MLEEVINIKLKELGINDIRRYSIDELSHFFNIKLERVPFESKALVFPCGGIGMFINQDLDIITEREVFFHELAHALAGHNSSTNLFRYSYFEGKADYISLILAIPRDLLLTYNFEDDDTFYKLSEDFKVSHKFVNKRIKLCAFNNQVQSKNYKQWIQFMLERKQRLDYEQS